MRELIWYFALRIKRDEIGLQASALSFTTVLALVPALTIVLSIFAMVPAFTPVKEELMRFASENFLPVFTDAIGNSITTFVSHAASMTLTGSLMLFVVSLMLIRAIDIALNRIWRGGKRRIPITFAIYWTLLTVGPLSFGLMVWLTTKIIASKFFATTELAFAVQFIYFITPFFVEMAMIFAIYTVIPVAIVRFRDAFMGAFIMAIVFEVTKRVFSAFILNFSDYEAIYGALAAMPVLMMWIYLNWWMILIGAEITATIGEARDGASDDIPRLIYKLVETIGGGDNSKLREKYTSAYALQIQARAADIISKAEKAAAAETAKKVADMAAANLSKPISSLEKVEEKIVNTIDGVVHHKANSANTKDNATSSLAANYVSDNTSDTVMDAKAVASDNKAAAEVAAVAEEVAELPSTDERDTKSESAATASLDAADDVPESHKAEARL